MLEVKRRFGDVRACVHALESWVIETLGEMGVEARTIEERVGVWVRRQRRRDEARQDRGDRGAPAALGELARARSQRQSRFGTLRGHRAVRDPRRRGDEPCRTGRRTSMEDVDGALRRVFERRFAPTRDVGVQISPRNLHEQIPSE
jgi:hypothetical protein